MTLSTNTGTISDEIARLAKKLRAKTERVHDLSGVGYNDDADCHRAADLLEELSRRSASTAGGVGVKALQWEFGQRTAEAAVPFGEYQVAEYTEADGMGYVATFNDAMEIGEFPTSDAAIAACQSHYEKNTLSSLHPADGEPVATGVVQVKCSQCNGRGAYSRGPYPATTCNGCGGKGYVVQDAPKSPTRPSNPVSAEVTEAAVDRALAALWKAQGNGWTQHSAMRSALIASIHGDRDNE